MCIFLQNTALKDEFRSKRIEMKRKRKTTRDPHHTENIGFDPQKSPNTYFRLIFGQKPFKNDPAIQMIILHRSGAPRTSPKQMKKIKM